jgi:Flp pilus assembly protein TadG
MNQPLNHQLCKQQLLNKKLFHKKLINQYQGAAMVEFALILPVFLLILFGIINYSILLFDQAIITNAAREGARWGSIHTTQTTTAVCSSSAAGTTDPCGIANRYASTGLISFGSSTVSASSTGDGTSGSEVTVTMTYQYTGLGYSLTSFDNQLSAKAVMYHE